MSAAYPNPQRILRCAELAKRAMLRCKYNLAHRLVAEVPGQIGVQMKMLIIEHECGPDRAVNSAE
ncbi:hypothetical protein [Marinimicrobium sp. ABcell2]|uniref:hypothetical protein n=1 Tax=Marinimicrobium sp. ABcell2 TaxID=3069751 RepID=UPI0027B5379B|nr:hypothetical protein [Marinimicrobium sp. ABcell2]MDQ2077456.1 hypothetical protein [Marinimicrobium sp. ABcell2]